MAGERAELLTRRARGHVEVADAGDGRLRARAVVLGKAEVVVRAEVERADGAARVVERPVVVVRGALHELDLGARHAAYGPVEAVADANVNVARVEALVALIQRHEILFLLLFA